MGALSKVRNCVVTVVPAFTTLSSELTRWLLMPISPRRYQPEVSKTGAMQGGAPGTPHGGGGPRSAARAAGIASSTAAPAAASNRVLPMGFVRPLTRGRAYEAADPKQSTDRECSLFVKWDLTLPFNHEH